MQSTAGRWDPGLLHPHPRYLGHARCIAGPSSLCHLRKTARKEEFKPRFMDDEAKGHASQLTAWGGRQLSGQCRDPASL